MRRNSKRTTDSPDTIANIAALTKANFTILTKLPQWMAAQEKAQRKYMFATINKLCRIEAAISLLLVDQMAHTQTKHPFYFKENLYKDARAAEEFISLQAEKVGERVVRYIYAEKPKENERHDRRRKWHGWEI